MVLFKRIEEFPDYFISMDGQVYNDKKYFFLKPSLSDGYLRVRLGKDKKWCSRSIHRLSGDAFIERVGYIGVIDHIDRDKMNNSLENLRWVTQRKNCHNRTDQSMYGHNITITKRPDRNLMS